MRKTAFEQKHAGTEKLLPSCEAKAHKAVHAPFTIAINPTKCSFLFFLSIQHSHGRFEVPMSFYALC